VQNLKKYEEKTRDLKLSAKLKKEQQNYIVEVDWPKLIRKKEPEA
jgi:hypothetical protein